VSGDIDHQALLWKRGQAFRGRCADQHQASHERRPCLGKRQSYLRAIVNAQDIDLPQPQVIGKAGNRRGGIRNTLRGRWIRFAVARQVGRIDRAYVGKLGQEAAEKAARGIEGMEAKQGHIFVEPARRRKGRAHMQLSEFTVKIGPAGANGRGRNGKLGLDHLRLRERRPAPVTGTLPTPTVAFKLH
jgi:hypothetical protein